LTGPEVYSINSIAGQIDILNKVKTVHRPINLINIEQSLKKSVKKMQQTCIRILVEHMIGD
jgi:hypothetical protein